MDKSFQARIQYAIKCVNGNQSELARRVSALVGRKVTAQAIQKLADSTAEKPATSSGLTVAIAKAADINPYWLALGVGEPHLPEDDLAALTMQKIRDGTVSKPLQETLYSLMRAIVGDQQPSPIPHAAQPIADYTTRYTGKKEATA